MVSKFHGVQAVDAHNLPFFSLDVNFQLSPREERHAKAILQAVPALSLLRYSLCPRKMREEVWGFIPFSF